MALDGEKLRQIRIAKGISQEKLALMCNVNKRTIQRAEKGQPIALETAAFIADAVQVPTATLRSSQIELFEPATKAWNDVVLIPVTSGRRIVDVLRQSFEAELTFDVEPTQENLKPLALLAALLEPFKPNPWGHPDARYAPGYAEVLAKQADVNGVLPSLAAMGISIFVAAYTALRKIPHYDIDTGEVYTTNRTSFSQVQVALIVVSDTSSSHLMRRPDDIFDVSGEIPF
jgi:transcriptional regulator with XRE-family HTH domain